MYQPLAEILRPKILSDVIGQKHLLGKDKPLTILAQSNNPQSIILWGPPGIGKTTIANILINTWQCEFIKLSAVFSGIKEIKEALEHASKKTNSLFDKQVVIFIDEIHRFNKAQQDAFLHHLENGKIIIIGATTENPSFELNNALLSRLQVFVLNSLTKEDLASLLDKSLIKIKAKFNLDKEARELIIDLADGDARRLKRFDKGQDEFYNQISAIHKSLRGSNPDAALYWFMRMIDGGADPLYIGRRLLRFAWEDIGLADINAPNLVINAIQTYERLGSPEGELALANAVIYLAVTPKSNSAYTAFNKVKDFINKSGSHEVPIHLRNAPTKLMTDLGYGKEYKYAHNFPNHYVANENYWPNDLTAQQFYTPSNQGMEQRIEARLKFLNDLNTKEK
ncbi:MAG TPA: replication-associated recombination protein A [Burkholderiales bacterium]|nr:replication-associated recombination protein A [Burkholderiales bacterium]